ERLDDYFPKDKAKLAEMRKMLGAALRSMVGDAMPRPEDVVVLSHQYEGSGGSMSGRLILSRRGQKERVRVAYIHRTDWDGRVVIWVHPKGLASISDPEALAIVEHNAMLLAVEVLRTGDGAKAKSFPVDEKFAGYT